MNEIKMRTLETGHQMGTGQDFYAHFLCAQCNELVDTHQDPGVWMPRNHVYCYPCACKLRENRPAKKVSRLNIPDKYVLAQIEDFPPRIKRKVTTWPLRNRSLGIIGLPGSGKTHLIWAIIKAAADRGKRVTYTSSAKLHGEFVKNSFASGRNKYEGSLVHSAYLVVDSFEVCPFSPGWTFFMTSVIEQRFKKGSPTIIALGCNFEEIGNHYGKDMKEVIADFKWVVLPERKKK